MLRAGRAYDREGGEGNREEVRQKEGLPFGRGLHSSDPPQVRQPSWQQEKHNTKEEQKQ